jgi:hypothetical protein
MLFRIVDHYNIELDEFNKNLESAECFICYETIFEDEVNPIKLNSNTNYIKNCKCDVFMHKKCLDIWYAKNKKCPICRKYMSENTTITIELLNKGSYILFAYIIVKKNIIKIMRGFMILFFIFSIFDLYLTIYHKELYKDYQKESHYLKIEDLK